MIILNFLITIEETEAKSAMLIPTYDIFIASLSLHFEYLEIFKKKNI